MTILLIISKNTKSCSSQNMFAHSSHCKNCNALGFTWQGVGICFFISDTVLRNNLHAGVTVTHPQIATLIAECSRYHFHRFTKNGMIGRQRSLQIVGLDRMRGRRYLFITADAVSLIAIAHQYRQGIVFLGWIFYGDDIVMMIGKSYTMKAISTHIPGKSVLRTYPHSALAVKMKHVDIIIGQSGSIFHIITKLYITFPIIYIKSCRSTDPHQFPTVTGDRRNALRREHHVIRGLLTFFL